MFMFINFGLYKNLNMVGSSSMAGMMPWVELKVRFPSGFKAML